MVVPVPWQGEDAAIGVEDPKDVIPFDRLSVALDLRRVPLPAAKYTQLMKEHDRPIKAD